MPSAKFSVCTPSTVVMIAAWGRTRRASGVISPAWFMPISNTANSASSGRRARVNGTPIWLLKLAALACVGRFGRPPASSARRSASLVLVLPTLPVTAATRARLRARAARPSPSRPRKVSATTSSGAAAGTSAGMCATMAAAAPAARAEATWSCPSWFGPLSATNRSPFCTVRLSIDTPVAANAAVVRPPVAAAVSCAVHSAALMPHLPLECRCRLPRPPRARPRGRRRDGRCRPRSGRARAPCRR